MSEQLHPDGLPVEATPECDGMHPSSLQGAAFVMEQRASRAEAEAAHLRDVLQAFMDVRKQSARIHMRELSEERAACDKVVEERDALKARVAELERTEAWLRAGPWAAHLSRDPENESEWAPDCSDWAHHADTKPPEGWNP